MHVLIEEHFDAIIGLAYPAAMTCSEGIQRKYRLVLYEGFVKEALEGAGGLNLILLWIMRWH